MSSAPAHLERLLWLYHAFHGAPEGSVTAAELERRYGEWGLERKTAVRDRKGLEAWGGTGYLSYDSSCRVWSLVRRFELPEDLRALLPAPERQGRLLSLARDLLRSTQGGESLVASVLDERAAEPSPYVTVFAPPRLGRSARPVSQLWLRLHEAIDARRRVLLGRKGKESVRVDPLHLWWAQGGWYLLARGSESGGLRNHALARLTGAEECFLGRRPDLYPSVGISPREWLGNGDWLYRGGRRATARIRFDAEAVASFQDRIWQSDAVWEEPLPDGSRVLLHPYPARSHGEWEMARRILGWGEYCTVEAPTSLRGRVTRLLADISRRYA